MVQLCNSKDICTKLNISRRTFFRLIPILKQFGLFQNSPNCKPHWYIRESNLDKYVKGLEDGTLQPLIKKWKQTTVEESAVLPRKQ